MTSNVADECKGNIKTDILINSIIGAEILYKRANYKIENIFFCFLMFVLNSALTGGIKTSPPPTEKETVHCRIHDNSHVLVHNRLGEQWIGSGAECLCCLETLRYNFFDTPFSEITTTFKRKITIKTLWNRAFFLAERLQNEVKHSLMNREYHRTKQKLIS